MLTKKLDLEPISRDMSQRVDPNRPITLRNHIKMDWTDQQNKGQPRASKFSEEELIELMSKCIDKKLIVAISGKPRLTQGLTSVPDSILQAVRSLKTLFANLIDPPSVHLKYYEWKYLQGLLKTKIMNVPPPDPARIGSSALPPQQQHHD